MEVRLLSDLGCGNLKGGRRKKNETGNNLSLDSLSLMAHTRLLHHQMTLFASKLDESWQLNAPCNLLPITLLDIITWYK